MNKSTILAVAVLGLVAFVSASPVPGESDIDSEISELKIKPTDDGEVKYLAPEHQIFTSFCKDSRDETYTFFADLNKEVLSNMFAIFFGSISDVTEQLKAVQDVEAEKAVEAIKTGVDPLPEGQVTKEQAAAHVEKSVGLLARIGGALSSYAKALGDAAMKELLVRLTLLKSTVSMENFKDVVTQFCGKIQLELVPRLQKMFKDNKADIKKDEPSKETASMLANAAFEKVGCLTTGRVRKAVNVCTVFNTAGPIVYSMMGI